MGSNQQAEKSNKAQDRPRQAEAGFDRAGSEAVSNDNLGSLGSAVRTRLAPPPSDVEEGGRSQAVIVRQLARAVVRKQGNIGFKRILASSKLPSREAKPTYVRSEGKMAPASRPVQRKAPFVEPAVQRQDEVFNGGGGSGSDSPSGRSTWASEEEAESHAADPEQLPPNARERLLRARTTLKNVEPLSEAQTEKLATAIPGAAVLDMIRERDEKHEQLELMQREAGEGRGLARPDLYDQLIADINRLDKMIKAAMAELDVADERELVTFINERFPPMFVDRAKQIAVAQLEENRKIAEAEAERYELEDSEAPEDARGLREAARHLHGLGKRLGEDIAELEKMRTGVKTSMAAQMPDAGMPEEEPSSQQDLDRLSGEINQERNEFKQKLQEYQLQYPILLRFIERQPPPMDLGRVVMAVAPLASATDEKLAQLTGGKVEEILENIEETKENIESDRLKVWDLNQIVSLTKQDLGIAGSPILEQAIQEHIGEAQTDQLILDTAVAALGITAGIVAVFASGGLAAGAMGVAVASGGYQLSESVQDYLAESSASDVALNPELSDISSKHPELFWVVLDLVGLGVDAAEAVKAFKVLKGPAQALMEGKGIDEFAKAAKATLKEGQAQEMIAKASSRAQVQESTQATIDAIGDAFRKADMDLIEGDIRWLAEQGFADIVADLRDAGKIHPLTEDALIKVFGEDKAHELIVEKGLMKPTTGGFFDVGSGDMFIRGGNPESVASVVVHEVTHHVQKEVGDQLTDFAAEYQAFMMQRAYLQRLGREGGYEAVPKNMRWLVDASLERKGPLNANDIEMHIMDAYGYSRPYGFDPKQTVEDVLSNLENIQAGAP